MDGTPVQLYGVAHYGEAESCAPHKARATLVDAVETVEEGGRGDGDCRV